MGGLGSGQYVRAPRHRLTTQLLSIDVRRWKKRGWLEPGQHFLLTWDGDGQQPDVFHVQTQLDALTAVSTKAIGEKRRAAHVRIVWTPCNLGGSRPWFKCPTARCSRRVAILYFDGSFACRDCHDLVHASQRLQPLDRALRRAGKIRRRLGWTPGIANGPGAKPKHMHQRTFYDLVAKHDQFVQFSLGGLRKNLRRLQARLGYHGP
jgi:hypothetical protein